MSDDEIFDLSLLGVTYALARHRRKKKEKVGRRKRRYWVHPILMKRAEQGAWTVIMEDFRVLYPDKHRQCMRLSSQSFDTILEVIRPDIEKQDTQLRKAIPAEQRLSVTLMFLATGDSIHTLSLLFRMGESTIRSIIYETCESIWTKMKGQYLKTPSTPAEWRTIAEGFYQHWNFPNCIGAIDGKHCAIQAPPNTASEFFNYKKFFSIVLLATCDSLYRFTYVDVGTTGRWSDGGTFDNCSLNNALNNGDLNLPPEQCLPGCAAAGPVPFVLIGDEAFPLKTNMLRPIPGRSLDSEAKRVYNYRLSRARRTIENAFGIMTARWRCLRKTLCMQPQNAEKIVLACCILHNFMRTERCAEYCPPGYGDVADANGEILAGAWRADVEAEVQPGIAPTNHRNHTIAATEARDKFIHYLNNEGALDWQLRHIRQT